MGLEVLVFLIALVIVVLVINKIVDLLSPSAGLAQIIHYVVGGIALIIALKKVWPLLSAVKLF